MTTSYRQGGKSRKQVTLNMEKESELGYSEGRGRIWGKVDSWSFRERCQDDLLKRTKQKGE